MHGAHSWQWRYDPVGGELTAFVSVCVVLRWLRGRLRVRPSSSASACALTSVVAVCCLFARGQSSASSADDQQIIGVGAVERFLKGRTGAVQRSRDETRRSSPSVAGGVANELASRPPSTVSSSAHHRGPAAADAGSDDGSALEASQRGGRLAQLSSAVGWRMPLTSGYLDFLAPNAAMANDERNETGN